MQIHKASNERGIALVLALFLMSALSVLGASLMFLAQTETYASMNYRMMSQARYAAEAGVNKAANFLLDPAQYQVPTVLPGTDPLGNYDTTKSPVQINGNPVILTSGTWTGVTVNYPVAAVKTAFDAAGQGTLTTGNSTVTYKTYAKLISMQQIDAYGGTQNVIQTWEITSDGGLAGSSKATVEVAATVETPKVSANAYAAFATAVQCGAINFNGNVSTDSYDSSVGPPTGAGNSTQASGGDVGTNGNMNITGNVTVNGNLYTPRPGVGSCTAGNITGLTGNLCGGSPCTAGVTGSMVKLPSTVIYPPPVFTTVPPNNTTVTITDPLGGSGNLTSANCTQLGLIASPLPGANCSVSGTTLTVSGGGVDVTLPNVVVGSGYTLVIQGANAPGQAVNINSLVGNNNSNITFDYATNSQQVILKVAGKMPDGTDMPVPFDLTQLNAWKQNKPSGANYDATALQIAYNGTANISMKGGNTADGATIYAPNATFTLQGGQDLYGSILAKTINNVGGASIHYDRRLQRDLHIAGNPMMGTFSWKRAQ